MLDARWNIKSMVWYVLTGPDWIDTRTDYCQQRLSKAEDNISPRVKSLDQELLTPHCYNHTIQNHVSLYARIRLEKLREL
jgi:hypothetical protein